MLLFDQVVYDSFIWIILSILFPSSFFLTWAASSTGTVQVMSEAIEAITVVFFRTSPL